MRLFSILTFLELTRISYTGHVAYCIRILWFQWSISVLWRGALTTMPILSLLHWKKYYFAQSWKLLPFYNKQNNKGRLLNMLIIRLREHSMPIASWKAWWRLCAGVCSSRVLSAFQAASKASIGCPQFDLWILGSSSSCYFSACKIQVILTACLIIWKDTIVAVEFLKEIGVEKVAIKFDWKHSLYYNYFKKIDLERTTFWKVVVSCFTLFGLLFSDQRY